MQYSVHVDNKRSKMRRFIFKLVYLLLIMGVGFGVGIYASNKHEVVRELGKKEVVYVGSVLGKYSSPAEGKLSQDIDFELFWDLWDRIQASYVDQEELNEKKMFYGALEGLAQSLNDPYTVFMEPSKAKEFNEGLEGKFEGIGAEIGIRDEVLTIIAPLDDMPAQKAGLMSGDKVLAIDSEVTSGITIDEAVKTIRGEKGTDVTLTVARKGMPETKDITITRGTIIVKSIRSELLEDESIYKIKITNFNNDTKLLMDERVMEILKSEPKGLILDLRNNPGGYLEVAIEIASEWVEDGIVVSEQFGNGRKNDFLARGRARLQNVPTVVLVNQGSASASEILAGALRDYEIAKLIGTKTFGKGSVQSLEGLRDGSQLKVTVAKWLTPNGNNINNDGLEPDYEVGLDYKDFQDGRDPQLDAAIEFLKTGDVDLAKYEKNIDEDVATSTIETEEEVGEDE